MEPTRLLAGRGRGARALVDERRPVRTARPESHRRSRRGQRSVLPDRSAQPAHLSASSRGGPLVARLQPSDARARAAQRHREGDLRCLDSHGRCRGCGQSAGCGRDAAPDRRLQRAVVLGSAHSGGARKQIDVTDAERRTSGSDQTTPSLEPVDDLTQRQIADLARCSGPP